LKRSARFSTLLIIAIIAALAGGQAPAQTAPAPPAAGPRELTIPAIFAEGGLTGRAPETIKWSPDGTKVSYVLRDDAGVRGQLYYVDVASGKPAVLVAQEKLATLAPPASSLKDERERERRSRYSVAGYFWAPDSKHILFDSNGQLWLYSLDTGTAVQVTTNNDPASDPKFSPDGKHVAYVRAHNLYVRSLKGGEPEKSLTARDRGDEKAGEEDDSLLNGEVDWVYAEELDVRSNYFWSPDGKQIAYLQMDESKVPQYPITDFIPTHATVDKQRYPQPGDSNPAVRVGVVGAGGGKTRWINVPQRSGDDESPADYYIPRFGWVRPGLLYIMVLNRAQDRIDLYFADASSGAVRKVLSDTSKNWVNVEEPHFVLPGQFLWLSWRSGYTHIYRYSYSDADPLSAEAKLEMPLTGGDFEVFSVDGFQKGGENTGGLVYFTSNQGDARQRQLWAVKLSGGDAVRISREHGTHAATFPDNGAGYYVDNYSAVMDPPRLSLCSTRETGACSVFWQSRAVDEFRLTPPHFVDFKADDGTVLHGSLLLPEGAAAGAAKVPLILAPYGGPGAQTVRDQWGGSTFLFHQLMARRGFAILQVDNRGMAGRGQAFAAALRHNFGEVEVKDQLTALDQALEKFPQLDRDRLGLWGWSYGGYLTLMMMTHSDRFKAGVSVAPVTDWRNYDSIYTERYMGLPKDNAQGYKKGSPIHSAGQLSGRVLIVHGTSDDNVHTQNTIQMTNELINAGKQFDLMLYPRKTHGIAGSTARTNLFTKIQEHFEKGLK